MIPSTEQESAAAQSSTQEQSAAPARASASEQEELQRLRSRVQALEAELVEVQARADAAVGEWQERAYWLDRWHLDLNAIMRKPGAAEFRAAVRAVRSVVWAYKRTKRRLKQP